MIQPRVRPETTLAMDAANALVSAIRLLRQAYFLSDDAHNRRTLAAAEQAAQRASDLLMKLEAVQRAYMGTEGPAHG